MEKMNITTHTKEACDMYRNFCMHKSKGKTVNVVELRAFFAENGMSCLTNDGEEMKHAGVRLTLNKFIGLWRRVSVHKGKFASLDEAEAYTKGIFKKIKEPPEMDEFDDIDW